MLTTSNCWTHKAQEVFAAEKAALLRDLLIKAKRELTYEPIALGGPGSPWLMKWKEGAPILPEEWELLGGTGDSSIERHIKAEKEEVKYADEYLSGIYRIFGELLRSQNINESAFLVEELYQNELWPVFEGLELAISYDNYNLLFEKWNFKLKARTKTVEHGQTQPVATGNKRSGRKRDGTITDRNKEIAALAASGKTPLQIAKHLDARRVPVPNSWTIKDGDEESYTVENFEKAHSIPQLRKKLNDLIYEAKNPRARVVG